MSPLSDARSGMRVGFVISGLRGEFQFHRRLAFEGHVLPESAQGGNGVEEPAHAAGARAIQPAGEHGGQGLLLGLRRTIGR